MSISHNLEQSSIKFWCENCIMP